MDKTHFRARIEAEQQELRMLSEAGRNPLRRLCLTSNLRSVAWTVRQQSWIWRRSGARRRSRCWRQMRRLDQDEFGYCLAFGEHISWRLEIGLAVTLCVDCQQ